MYKYLILVLLFIMQAGGPSQAGTLHDAARNGDAAAVETALAAGGQVDTIANGVTPLYLAARRGHVEVTKLLIERGADVNRFTSQGTALTAAAEKARVEVMVVLLQKGADPNIETKGEVPLHLVVRQNCLPCVMLLVEAGADVNAVAFDGKTPLHMAKSLSYDDIADYLISHGVRSPVVAPISANLATASPASGRSLFVKHCARCHKIDRHKPHSTGPNLWDVVGQSKASADFENYSKVLQMWPGVWSPDELNRFLSAPMAVLPGTAMDFPGLTSDAERADVIAYLETLRDH